MGEMIELIRRVKEDKNSFPLIMDKFDPLLKKYTKLLFKDEAEDIRSEYTLALWEAICNISYYENEGQITNYLCRAIQNKYLELYRNSKKYHNYIVNIEEEHFSTLQYNENSYDDVVLKNALEDIKKSYIGKKQEIFNLSYCENYSDIEIAKKLGITRQYVHRIKMLIRDDLKKIFLK